jgi:Phosphotransferase enzyme family
LFIYKIGSRALIAIPDSPVPVKRKSVDRLFPNRWEQRLLRIAVRVAIGSRLDLLMRSVSTLPAPKAAFGLLDHRRLIRQFRVELNPEVEHVTVIWPQGLKRDRLFLHLLDGSGEPLYFAKMSFSRYRDAALAREAIALQTLGSKRLFTCRVPAFVGQLDHEGRKVLVVDPMPAAARPHGVEYPRRAVAEYQGVSSMVRIAELSSTDWWRRFEPHAEKVPALAHFLRAEADAAVEVCRVHGDLGRSNLFADGDHTWIVDWEHSAVGPRLVDPLTFWVSAVSRKRRLVRPDDPNPVQRAPERMEALVAGALEEGGPPRVHELGVALAYLMTVQPRRAAALAVHWPTAPFECTRTSYAETTVFC